MDYWGHYINGQFEFYNKTSPVKTLKGWKDHFSPADLDDRIFSLPLEPTAPLSLAFEKGTQAYLPWSQLTLPERVEKLQPLKKILKKEWKELSPYSVP